MVPVTTELSSDSVSILPHTAVYAKSLRRVHVDEESRQFPDKTVPRHGFWRQFPDRFEDSSPTLFENGSPTLLFSQMTCD